MGKAFFLLFLSEREIHPFTSHPQSIAGEIGPPVAEKFALCLWIISIN
jgi:hypothetical protein